MNGDFEIIDGVLTKYFGEDKEIVIPDGVTGIGEEAFVGCNRLNRISIPESVKSIEGSPFDGCSSLTNIVVDKKNSFYDSREDCNAIIETRTNTLIAGCQNTIIPESVISIGESAFDGCSNLTSIIIPKGVKSIENWAFHWCDSLKNIIIPEGVKSIGNEAFYGCSSLTSITIPEGVTNIGENAFLGCSNLAEIVVDKNNKVYDSRENCNAIIETQTNTLIEGCQNTMIPESVTSIGTCAFDGCDSLTNIIVPEGVKKIENHAFLGCESLKSITVPSSVMSIEGNPFENCSSLTEIVVDKNNKVYDSRENCNAIIESQTNTLVIGCQNTIIPESVISIGVGAFVTCFFFNPGSITIPESVTSIGSWAFVRNSKLKSIKIPRSVAYIGNRAFDETTTLIVKKGSFGEEYAKENGYTYEVRE